MLQKLFLVLFALYSPCLSYSQLPNWVEQSTGTTQTLTSAHTSSIIIGPSFVWACGNAGTVLRSTNDGTNWQSAGGNGIPVATHLVNIVGIDANTAVTAGYIGGTTYVFRTSNAGANWTQVFTENNGFINGVCFQNQLSGFMTGDPVGGRWSLWKTSNGGVNWDSTGLYLPQADEEAGWNNSIWNIGNSIWFGTSNSKIYYSTNFGSNWTAQPTIGLYNSFAVWFYPLSGGNEGLAGGSEMYRTSNYGATWTLQETGGIGNFTGITGGPNIIVNSIGFMYTFSVSGTSSIFTSTNDGTNWYSQYTAPGGLYQYIGTNFYGNKFWGVRSNGGISYLDMASSGIITLSNEVPDNYSLYQNYPNPFNPNTKIKFQTNKTSGVKLTVYDQLGREVKILVNEILQAGTYETEFNASDNVSGVYFYKLETEDFTNVKKMILLK